MCMGVHKVHACTSAQGNSPHHHPWPRPSSLGSPHPTCCPASSSNRTAVSLLGVPGLPWQQMALQLPHAPAPCSRCLPGSCCPQTQGGPRPSEELQCTQKSPACSQVFGFNHVLSRNSSLQSSPFLPLLFYKEDPNAAAVPRAKLAVLSRRVCRRGEPGQEGRKTPGLFQAVTWESHPPHNVPISPQLSWTCAGAALGLPL